MTSRVASSAQWRSSRITMHGGCDRNWSSNAAATSWGRPPRTMIASRSPPVVWAMSSSGPSGCGVARASHAPQRICTDRPAQKRRTREVLPTPASPPIKTKRPAEDIVTSAKWLSSAASGSARSSRAPDPATACDIFTALPPVNRSKCTSTDLPFLAGGSTLRTQARSGGECRRFGVGSKMGNRKRQSG